MSGWDPAPASVRPIPRCVCCGKPLPLGQVTIVELAGGLAHRSCALDEYAAEVVATNDTRRT